MCCTPYFLEGVVLPDNTTDGITVPEAIYGPGFLLFTAYFPVIFSLAIYNFIKIIRAATGVQRVELQFVLTAIAMAIPISLVIHLSAVWFKSSQPQQFGPLSIIPINLVIAYGIATQRILDVGTVLRKATSYLLLIIYLTLLYLALLFSFRFLFLTFQLPKILPEIISTICVALSMAPAHGKLQRVADKLIVSHSMDVPATMRRASDIFQSVTTIDALLKQFSELLQTALQANNVYILLKSDSLFIQRFPKSEKGSAIQLEISSRISSFVMQTKEAVSQDNLIRARTTEQNRTAATQLSELNASVATGIFSKSQLAGVVLFGSRIGDRIYDRTELDALQLLCNQFAVALENAHLYTEMQDSKIRNDILLDQLVSGVIVASPDRKITMINHEAQRIIGLKEGLAIGQDIRLLPPAIESALAATLSDHTGIRNLDTKLAPQEEESTSIRMGSAYLMGHDDKPMGALLVFTDMTEIKGLEEHVRRSDQLSSVGTLAAGMAHEIKNPLVTIKTFTQLLPDRYADEDFRKDFSSLVGQEVARIDGIVNQLLSFSKPAKPTLVPMHLHETIEQLFKLMQEQASQKNITFQSNLNAENDQINGDEALLFQALVNLNLNAMDAIEYDGTIQVKTSNCKYRLANSKGTGNAKEKRCIHFQIADSGKGIDEKSLQKIFDPFFTSKSEGTGMGLSVSHGIVHEHHGAIEVESKIGKGTTFHIYIPLLEEALS